MQLDKDALIHFQAYFEQIVGETVVQIERSHASSRLIDNKVRGFFISLGDKLLDMGILQTCKQCGNIKNDFPSSSDIRNTHVLKTGDDGSYSVKRFNTRDFAGYGDQIMKQQQQSLIRIQQTPQTPVMTSVFEDAQNFIEAASSLSSIYDTQQNYGYGPSAFFHRRDHKADKDNGLSVISSQQRNQADMDYIMRQFLKSPPVPIIDYQSEHAAHHLNVVSVRGKRYIITNNKSNQVDFIQASGESNQAEFTLPIDQMQCSFETSTYLFIGAQTKLYLIDKQANILSHVKVLRNIQSICQTGSMTIVVGQQGGQLAAIEIDKDRQMKIVVQTKVLSGIYKLLVTISGEIAVASSTGLYFCRYDPVDKKFQLLSDFFVSDQIVTQVVEISQGRFLCGIWENSYVVLCQQGGKAAPVKIIFGGGETQCTDFVSVPDFDLKKNPFIIVRTNLGLYLIDLSAQQIQQLCQVSNQRSSFEKMRLIQEDADFKMIISNKSGSVQQLLIKNSFFSDLKQLAK